ncbi:MAG: SulP family inorganic anion transporter, partial [Cyanobacteria bacterium J06638_6]
IGQGIGNVISGLFGGLPGAGATMRTVINVQAGGRTPLSGIIHALVLLMVVFWAGPLTAQIPNAVLAGILLKVGLDILDWGFIKRAPKLSLRGTGIMYLVMFLTVFVDLITAVLVGAFVANVLTIKRLTDVQSDHIKTITAATAATADSDLTDAEKSILNQSQGNMLLFQLGGPMSFGAAKSISRRLSIVKNYQALVLDLSEVPMLGVTAALALESIVQDAVKRDRHVWIVVKPGQVQNRIENLDLQRFIAPGKRSDAVVSTIHFSEYREQALRSALMLSQPKAASAHRTKG